MKRVFTYFLFVLLTVQTFSQLIIVGKFLYNQDFIAANLCDNQDKPELECNGKCHLKKELKEDTKKNHNDNIVVSENILFFHKQDNEISLDEPSYFDKKNSYSHYLEKELTEFNTSVFHPPC